MRRQLSVWFACSQWRNPDYDKKGKAGKAQVSFNMSGGFSNAAVDFRPTLNGDQRRELLYEGLVNYATDKQMTDPTGYADGEIDKMRLCLPWAIPTGERNCFVPPSSRITSICIRRKREDHFLCLFGYNSQEGLAKNSSLDRYSARLNMTQKVGGTVR